MPIARFEMPDGKIARFDVPEGTTPEQAQAQIEQFVASQETPFQPIEEPTFGQEVVGLAEAAGAVATGAIAEPIAGVAGIAQAINPFAEPGAGGRAVEATREALTFEPSTEEGRANIQSLAKTLQPITDILQSAEKASGDIGFYIAGPIGGAIGAAIPTALSEALGIGAAKGAAAVGRKAKAAAGDLPDVPEIAIVETGEAAGVPILTTDVLPPKTAAGKFTQQTLEKFGPFGTGTIRAKQQAARENVVEEIAKEFDVELDSPFAEDIVKSLKKNNLRVLSEASEQRNKAIDALVPFGDVPTNKTVAAIDEQLAKQASLGEKANTALVDNLNAIKNSIAGDFSHLRDIRTEVIDDLKALGRSEDRRAEGSLQQVKSAIDKDMIAFARINDKQAAADWLRSNRKFANELQKTKRTELKRILDGGDATPEKVLTILKGGKSSELKRLNSSLTPKGRSAARASIIQNALDQSGFFRDQINPDRFTTAINKTNTKRAIDAFFSPQDKKALDGLTKVLDATRRAQQAQALPSTGVQTIPAAALATTTAGLVTDALTTLGTVATVSGLARIFESAKVRNILLKISNTPPGTKQQERLMESLGLALTSAVQASKEGTQEQQVK